MNVQEALQAGQAAEEGGDLVGAAAAFASVADDRDPRVAANAKFHLGRVVWKQGRLDEAIALCGEARAAAITLRDEDLRARVENAIGVLHVARGEYAQAKAAYAVAYDLTKEGVTRAKILLNLGVIANIQSAFDVAQRHYEQSLAMFREANDERGAALALHNLGMLRADREEWDEADEAFREALSLFERHGNRQMIANVLVNRSEVGYGRKRTHEAIAQCDLALTIYAEIGDETSRAEALRWKGHGLRLLGRLAEADATLSEAIRIAERTRARLLEAEATREAGWVRRAQGRATDARGALKRALKIFTELGAHREVQELMTELAQDK